MNDNLRKLAQQGWKDIMLTHWGADEEHSEKWLAKAGKTAETGGSGYDIKVWQWGETPERAVKLLLERVTILQIL